MKTKNNILGSSIKSILILKGSESSPAMEACRAVLCKRGSEKGFVNDKGGEDFNLIESE
jgi:hypothetical protein